MYSESGKNCGCILINLLIQSVVVILIIVLFVQIYKITMMQNEFLSNQKNYMGHSLINSINDSGADLRILGQKFSSTDQGSEKFY